MRPVFNVFGHAFFAFVVINNWYTSSGNKQLLLQNWLLCTALLAIKSCHNLSIIVTIDNFGLAISEHQIIVLVLKID